MAAEAVSDDSKNESGIPRAVFVVRDIIYIFVLRWTSLKHIYTDLSENRLLYQ